MTTITQSAFVPYSCAEMFDLVNDIEQYPLFLPWCPSAEIVHRADDEIKATLYFAKGALGKSFTTLNRLLPHQRVEMRLVEGPFRHLQGAWEFQPASEKKGSHITFNLSFEFNNKLLALSLGPIFHHIANTMVEAFTQRAHQLYAK